VSSKKWWEKIIDALRKWLGGSVSAPPPMPVPSPVPSPASATGPLIDPPGFDDAYLSANAGREECGMDGATGVFRFRCTVIRAESKKTCIISSVFEKHFTKNADGSIALDDNFVEKGAVWHIRGFAADEPKPNEQNPAIVSTGNVWRPGTPTWSVWECRAVTQA
jgi:hypothetical protein